MRYVNAIIINRTTNRYTEWFHTDVEPIDIVVGSYLKAAETLELIIPAFKHDSVETITY